jgi:hypothetical protein
VPERRPARYVAENRNIARNNPALRAAIERSGDLVRQGVALIHSFEHRSVPTDLEAIKPG